MKPGVSLTLLLVILIGAACTPAPGTAPPATTAPPPPPPGGPTLAPATTPAPAPTSTPPPPLPTATVTATPDVLPPAPIPVQFHAADGQALEGIYYPAGVEHAPTVVLMHWAGGSMEDWVEIAFWLQNRRQGGQTPNPENRPWLDPSWFPPLEQGRSYAVFSFTFRGCGPDGCRRFQPAGWLMDAQAAMKTASELAKVDPGWVAAVGASIGADGAPDGCFWLNDQDGPGRCPGAFSFSPGGYLNVPYADAVAHLGGQQPPAPAWCLYSEDDRESQTACTSATGENYSATSYPGELHGMMLIQPGLTPDALELLLEFLELVAGP